MTIEANFIGVACNLDCPYCYEHPQRDAGNIARPRDVDAILAQLEREGVGKPDGKGGKTTFTMFGGEALLLPLPELERVFQWAHEKAGGSTVQTNGTLITAAHVELFTRFNVSVGLSMDGPEDLNDSRWAGTLERTREATRASEQAIRALCAAGRPPGLIVTIYRGNAVGERLERLAAWFRELDALGVQSVRLHTLEVDHANVAAHYALTVEENAEALLRMARLQRELRGLRFDVFQDLLKLLKGKDEDTTCTWNACDPYTTSAVLAVDEAGGRANCGRTYKEGVPFEKAQKAGHERQVSLYHTPQEYGGCQGCRFFVACKGQCPGTAIDGDWRNRSAECAIWFRLFEHHESLLVAVDETPLSLAPDLTKIEQLMLAEWTAGRNITIQRAVARVRGLAPTPAAGDIPHGDKPHGDAPHGDHTDRALLGVAQVKR